MIRLCILFTVSLVFATKVFSANIGVIDINYLINNTKHFLEISEKINNSQSEFKKKFKNIEQNLYKIKSELEESKIILNEVEFNIKKDDYYNEVVKFENEVTKFNDHYENQIVNIKNIIFSKISDLIKDYAKKNKIDLIFEKNQYLLAADTIDISETIFIQLNESNIELKFETYEN